MYQNEQNDDIIIDEQIENTGNESLKRDVKYSEFLSTIISHAKSDRIMKNIFFYTVLVLLVSVCIVAFIIVFMLFLHPTNSNIDLVGCIGSFGTIVGAIITLPSIIANHLFPQNGEEVRLNFMKDIKQFDVSVKNPDTDIVESDIENPAEDLN